MVDALATVEKAGDKGAEILATQVAIFEDEKGLHKKPKKEVEASNNMLEGDILESTAEHRALVWGCWAILPIATVQILQLTAFQPIELLRVAAGSLFRIIPSFFHMHFAL